MMKLLVLNINIMTGLVVSGIWMGYIWMDLNSSVKIPSYIGIYYLPVVLISFIAVNSFVFNLENFPKIVILSIGVFVLWFIVSAPLAIWWHSYLGGTF